jgi:hypothetical protein
LSVMFRRHSATDLMAARRQNGLRSDAIAKRRQWTDWPPARPKSPRVAVA